MDPTSALDHLEISHSIDSTNLTRNSIVSNICPTDIQSATPSSNFPSIDCTNHPSLSALILNCQSLVAKKESFLNLLDLYHPDIVFSSESWLKPSISSNEVFPSGYIAYRRDRADGYGGVFIACRDTLASHDILLNECTSELVACHIQLTDHSSLIACSIYRPPSSSDLYLEDLCQQIEKIKEKFPNFAFWIAGDVNLPDINWCLNHITGHSYPLSLNRIFLDFLHNNALTQMVDMPTRGSHIIDIFLTNRPSLVELCTTIDGISDHEAIFVKALAVAHLSHPTKRTIYLWSKANFQRIREEVLSQCENFTNTYSDATPVDYPMDQFLENMQQWLRSSSHKT